MTASPAAKLSPAEKAERNRRKTRNWRSKMRAQGMRPVQLWIYDTRNPEFLAEARRQAGAAAASEHEAEIQAWIDDVSAGIWKE